MCVCECVSFSEFPQNWLLIAHFLTMAEKWYWIHIHESLRIQNQNGVHIVVAVESLVGWSTPNKIRFHRYRLSTAFVPFTVVIVFATKQTRSLTHSHRPFCNSNGRLNLVCGRRVAISAVICFVYFCSLLCLYAQRIVSIEIVWIMGLCFEDSKQMNYFPICKTTMFLVRFCR